MISPNNTEYPRCGSTNSSACVSSPKWKCDVTVCSKKCTIKYPVNTSSGALGPATRKLSGSISSSAVPSMNPAPSATKYCRYLRSQAFWTMAAPPRPLAAAAVSPSRMLIVTGFIGASRDEIPAARVARRNRTRLLQFPPSDGITHDWGLVCGLVGEDQDVPIQLVGPHLPGAGPIGHPGNIGIVVHHLFGHVNFVPTTIGGKPAHGRSFLFVGRFPCVLPFGAIGIHEFGTHVTVGGVDEIAFGVLA